VPTCRMGPPPEPGGPIYPGVSSKIFDPASAAKVYGDQLMKEMGSKYMALRLGSKMQHNSKGHNDLAIADMLPGYRSVESTYNRLGYKLGTIAWEPPHFPALPAPPTPIRRVDLQQPPPPRRSCSTTLARSASVPAASGSSLSANAPLGAGRRTGSSIVSANAPVGSRRAGGSNVSASAPIGSRRAGGSSVSANAPPGGSSLSATAPEGREEESQVGTNSTFWSLPPVDLSQLSLKAPPPFSRQSKMSEQLQIDNRFAQILKERVTMPFALL